MFHFLKCVTKKIEHFHDIEIVFSSLLVVLPQLYLHMTVSTLFSLDRFLLESDEAELKKTKQKSKPRVAEVP